MSYQPILNPLPVSGTGSVATPAAGIVTVQGIVGGAAQPVSGAFFQVTQPVSLATNTPDVIDRAARLLGHVTVDSAPVTAVTIATLPALTTGTAAIGTVGVTTLPALVAGTAAIGTVQVTVLPALPTGTNAIGTVSVSNFPPTQAVSIASNTPDVTDRAARQVGTVTQQALTKGTQGATGVMTQDLKDSGRNQTSYYTLIPVLTSATETLQSLTGTKGGATVVATTTPAVVTAGKTFRVTQMSASYISTATSGYALVRLRFQPAGVVLVTSPIAATFVTGNASPTVANASETTEVPLDEGWEFPAGTGVGISVQGFAGATAAAVGYVMVSITGCEY